MHNVTQCKLDIFQSLFQLKMCVNKEDTTYHWSSQPAQKTGPKCS